MHFELRVPLRQVRDLVLGCFYARLELPLFATA
jgi:hypothetical protein